MFFGADFSSLEETEALGGRFYRDGRQGDLIGILRGAGISAARLRLWVNPFNENGETYGAGTNDIECTARLAKRAKDAGMSFMLDFHYSDFWCDPSRQLVPRLWQGLSFEDICRKVNEHTAESIKYLASRGLAPDYVQIGNEITNGMLWDYGKLMREDRKPTRGFDRLCALLKQGVAAVRECCDAKIVLHLERSYDNETYREWFDAMREHRVDYDIIGVSYYPYWHRSMKLLKANLDDMVERYDKDIMVVETAYAFTDEYPDPDGENGKRMVGDTLVCYDGSPVPYPYTIGGQTDFVRDLIKLAAEIKDGRCKAIYYWEPAWLPLKGSTWATQAGKEYISETQYPSGNDWAYQCIFDYGGSANPALAEFSKYLEENKR